MPNYKKKNLGSALLYVNKITNFLKVSSQALKFFHKHKKLDIFVQMRPF